METPESSIHAINDVLQHAVLRKEKNFLSKPSIIHPSLRLLVNDDTDVNSVEEIVSRLASRVDTIESVDGDKVSDFDNSLQNLRSLVEATNARQAARIAGIDAQLDSLSEECSACAQRLEKSLTSVLADRSR